MTDSISSGNFIISDGLLWKYTGNDSDIHIPESVTGIAECTFLDNSTIRYVTLPRGITFIGRKCFEGCTNLSRITMPDSVRVIGEYAFSGCSGLRDVTLSAGMDAVGKYAFSGCTSLREIRIPDGVRTIEEGAFRDCTDLEMAYIPRSVARLEENSGQHPFSGSVKVTFYTPKNSAAEAFARANNIPYINVMNEPDVNIRFHTPADAQLLKELTDAVTEAASGSRSGPAKQSQSRQSPGAYPQPSYTQTPVMQPEPIIQPDPDHRSAPRRPDPKPVPGTAPKPVTKPAPVPVARPKPEPVARPKPEPVARPKPAPVAKPVPRPEPQAVPQSPVSQQRSEAPDRKTLRAENKMRRLEEKKLRLNEREQRRIEKERRRAEEARLRQEKADHRRAEAEQKRADAARRKQEDAERRQARTKEKRAAAEVRTENASAFSMKRITSLLLAAFIIGGLAMFFVTKYVVVPDSDAAEYTLEEFVESNPDARLQIQQSVDGTNVSVYVSGNQLIYKYDLSQTEGMTEEAAKDSEVIAALEETLDSGDNKFIELCKSLEGDTGINGITVKVAYTYGDEKLVSRTYTANGKY